MVEHPAVYKIWMAPFAESKFAPILRHNDLRTLSCVLDVGCGPGTNTDQFAEADDYLGIDINREYIEDARRRYGRDFEVADVTQFTPRSGSAPDFVLVNSFLHHLDTPRAAAVLDQVAKILSDDGHIHVIDLVLPEQRSVARLLARWDRGDHPRPLEV